MAKDYRAIRRSYGFRGKLWETGEIAEGVTPDEKINEHFVLASTPVPGEEPPEKEPETLSELQERENPSSERKARKK